MTAFTSSVTCPYPQPKQSRPCPPPPIPLNINFNIILPSTPRSSKWSHIPFAKSQASFPLLVSYQSISPSLSPCQTIRNVVSFYGEEFHHLVQHPRWGNASCRLTATAYSMYTLHICRPFLLPQPDDALI